MPVNTKSVQKRSLRFSSLSEVIAEGERVAAAHRSGKLKQLGNWSVDQILNHLASWASYPYDGYPPELSRPPWIIRLVLRLEKKTYLHKKLPQGVRIPGVKAGTVGMDAIGLEPALKKFKAALQRLDQSPPQTANLIFGRISHDEWRCINMRHAELHLGFLQPE